MPDNNTQMQMLKQEVEALKAELYKGNFSGSQDNGKFVRFTNKIRMPVYANAPSKCEQGEIYVNSGTGKVYVCSAANTWSLIGTQA